MISRVIVAGSSDAFIVAARIPNAAASTDERTQFTAASCSGDRPIRTAPFSSSAAARVASPNRVKRNAAHRATVAAMTSPARISWSLAMDVPSSSHRPLGEQRLDRHRLRAEAQHHDRLEDEQQADRGDRLGQRWGVAQRPEHQQVHQKSRGPTPLTRLRANAAPKVSGAPNDERGRPVRQVRPGCAQRVQRRPRAARGGSAAAAGTARPPAAAR